MDFVRGTHHLTMSVGPAQEDYDFHTQVLGLYSVKKTVLFDGDLAINHLYYGNRAGDASTLLTSFPFRQAGVKGRRGSNQIKLLNLAVPADALGFWSDRLKTNGFDVEEVEIFGTRRLHFAHPCGIEYALVGETVIDDRDVYEGNGVAAEHAIRGAYGVTVSVKETEEMAEFLTSAIGGEHLASDGPRQDFSIGDDSGYGRHIELLHEPDVPQATWRFGEGVVHHVALDCKDEATQTRAKAWIEGLGYTDASDSKDRQYFHSVYIRSPGGALVELAYSKPEGFTIDEDFENLGKDFMIPPQFENRRDEIMGTLEPIKTEPVAG
jgi:glyoxalase family protein